ncbi:MAG: type II toxin-antitoxin system HicA family toxin [Clostridiales Family XIII bacterium]|nr:type II toxin-antitoxin system HicA family toxin [Clostridiales Family XIII bacterium]
MPAIYIKDVLKLLKENGFEEVRCTGDHHRFEDGNDKEIYKWQIRIMWFIPPYLNRKTNRALTAYSMYRFRMCRDA